MTERIPLCGARIPFGENIPFDELDVEYIEMVIQDSLLGRKYISHSVEREEKRDGSLVHNGLEMPASRIEYYILLNSEDAPKVTEQQDADKEL